MSEPDTQDQGQGGVELPSALRPRSGWDKAAHNPEAVHNPYIDAAAVPSSGYMSPEYQPPRGTSPGAESEDALATDQSAFGVAQQGHLLGRTGERTDSAGAVGSDGRPGWDSRHHVASKTDRDPAPPAQILRPPSSTAAPGQSYATGGLGAAGAGAAGDTGMEGGAAEGGSSEAGAGAGLGLGQGRTTQLPGLNATSPASLRPSPYASTSGAAGTGGAAGAAPGSPSRGSGTASPAPAAGTGRPDLADTYVGRAYSPDGTVKRGGGAGQQPGAASSADGAGAGGGAEAGGDTGVDGHGTHLPALDKAYLYHQGKKPPFDLGFGTGGVGNTRGRRGVAAAPGGGGSTARAAAAKEDSLSWLAPAPGALYMPANGTKRRGASQPRSARPARDRQLVPVPPPLPLTSRLHHSGAGGHEGGGRVGGQSADGGMPTRRRDDTMRASAGVWRPSGKQPIPDALPSPGRSTYRAKAEGEASRETQEEGDRRRAQPRTFSPDRYPIVGQGWSFTPEKIAVNPAYKDVRPKYLEAKPPAEADNTTPHLPHIDNHHGKPWLTPGKHLLSDSSTPAPKVDSAGRPSYLPAAGPSGPSVSSPSGVAASLGSTLNRTGGAGGKAWGGGKGAPAAKPRRRPLVKQETYSGSGSDNDDDTPEGDREVLAVIGGVRLMSMVRRGEMAAEIHRQAQEDAEMEAEDRAREEVDHRGERGGSAPSGEQPVAGAAADATAASRSSVGAGAESSKTQASSEPQREQRWASEPEQQDADDGAKEDAAPAPPAADAEREEDTPPVAPACVSKRPSGASTVSKSDSVGSAGSAAGAQSRVSREDGSDGVDAPGGGGDAAEKEEEEEEGETAREAEQEEEAGGDGEDDDGEDLGGVELPDEGAAAEDDAEEAEDNVELPDGADED